MASNPSSTEPSELPTSVTNDFDLSPYLSNKFIDDWLNATEILVGPSSDLDAKYKENRWVLDFLAPKKVPAELQDARVEFESNPALMIDTLLAFIDDFGLQQLGINLAQRQHGKIFLYLASEFKRRLDKTKDKTKTSEVLKSRAPISAMSARRQFEMPSPPAEKECLEHHKKFKDDVAALIDKYNSSNHYGDISTENAKYNTRRVVMGGLLREVGKDWGPELQGMLIAFQKLRNSGFWADSDLTEDDYWGNITGCTLIMLTGNIREFTGMMTGEVVKQDEQAGQCVDRLRTIGASRTQHLKPLFEQMQALQKTVNRQRQIITSLEYRRLLEHIPEKSYYIKTLQLNSQQQTATRFWQAAWKDWVKKELQTMLKKGSASGSASSPLADLFQFDLDRWKSKMAKKNKTSVPGTVPDTDFEEWLCYKRGLSLYGELSSNIHKYDDMKFSPYDIDDSNWSRSERIMLKALAPEHWKNSPDGAVSDVDWTEERKGRGLGLGIEDQSESPDSQGS